MPDYIELIFEMIYKCKGKNITRIISGEPYP